MIAMTRITKMNPPVSKPIPSDEDVEEEEEGEEAVPVESVDSEDIVKDGEFEEDEEEGATLGGLPFGGLIESDVNRDEGDDSGDGGGMEISSSPKALKDEVIVRRGYEANLGARRGRGRRGGGIQREREREMRGGERKNCTFVRRKRGGCPNVFIRFVKVVRRAVAGTAPQNQPPAAPCPKARKVQGESCMRGSYRGAT